MSRGYDKHPITLSTNALSRSVVKERERKSRTRKKGES
jgi:hypothetical protein